MTPGQMLERWLTARLSAGEAAWLAGGIRQLGAGAADRDLYLLTSLVSRRVGKDPLMLTQADLQAAWASRPGWDPRDWTLDQAARVCLLLASTSDGAAMTRRLNCLCSAADVSELVAFYRGLPLYPDQPSHALRAAEGIRSNMRAVFEAVAHRNPYPSENLSEAAWNQLVLKALFIGSALDPIVGLDTRRNPTLARMICDYALERWAASRPISPESWRCVGPFAEGPLLEIVARLLERGTAAEQQAAALALREAVDPAATRLLESHADIARSVRDGNLSWTRLATCPS